MDTSGNTDWARLRNVAMKSEEKKTVFEGNSGAGLGIGEKVIREIRDQRDVPAAVAEISETVNRIEAIAGDLESKLAFVLADVLNRPEGALDSDSPRSRCALSVDLRNLDERLEVVWARLSMLLTRIEV